MATTPNWASVTVLKSPMYLDFKDNDAPRDASLLLLAQMITNEMICYLDNSAVDPAAPTLDLQRVCLEQCCYEWKQRKTPGLQSVQMQDGSINKFQIDEWLKNVEKVLLRHKRFALYEGDC